MPPLDPCTMPPAIWVPHERCVKDQGRAAMPVTPLSRTRTSLGDVPISQSCKAANYTLWNQDSLHSR